MSLKHRLTRLLGLTNQAPTRSLKSDSYLVRPALTALFLFLASWFFFYVDFLAIAFWFVLVVFLMVSIAKGLVKIFQNFFKQGVSHLATSIIFLALLFTPIRLYELHARHYLQFIAGKQRYEAEVEQMDKSVPRYKEWLWSSNGTSLVFDETDHVLLKQSTPKDDHECDRVYKLESHFYAVEFFC